ncbi:hypothetical protein [Pseudarthrobacter sp. S9]|uniref:hypothetical protein n=1 Tax=Pseudarthrobacter sp. S9 TaxID=3418421 RepID=UPI003D0235BB
MNHKLRVLVRVDVDPGRVNLEVTGCVTRSESPALLQIVRRAGRLGAGTDVTIDLHGAAHLDPEVLLDLRRMADAGIQNGPDAGDSGETAAPGGTGQFRLALDEPAELPICLLHVGADGEVLAGLDARLGEACSQVPAELNTVSGLELSDNFEGTVDPGATVRALSDSALCQLADALYRHLDSSYPSFGAHTWYELAAEELRNRDLTDGSGPAEDELPAGQPPA